MQTKEVIWVEDDWSSGAIIWVTDFSYLGSSCALLNTFFASADRGSLVPLEFKELYLACQVKKTFSKQRSMDVGKEETKVK